MARHTKGGRRAAFRAFATAWTAENPFVFRLTPLSERCYAARCGGTGWLDCWCGFCGEEQCYGCRDCDAPPSDDDDGAWTADDQDAWDESAFMRGVL